MAELDRGNPPEGESYYFFGFTESDDPESAHVQRYITRSLSENYPGKFTFGQLARISGFVKLPEGISVMPEPSYITKIYTDIEQLRTEQDRRFTSIETGLEEVKGDLKEFRKEVKKDIKSGINDAKEALNMRFNDMETRFDIISKRFDDLSWYSKAGLLGIFMTCLIGFIGIWYKLS